MVKLGTLTLAVPKYKVNKGIRYELFRDGGKSGMAPVKGPKTDDNETY